MFFPRSSIAALKAFVTVLLLPQFHYPSTMHAQNRSGSTSGSLLAPPDALIEEDILSAGKARRPEPKATPRLRTSNTHIPLVPKPYHGHIPKAPRPDVHAFLPPPYSQSASFLAVPNNTPASTPPPPPLSSSSSSDDSVMLSTPNIFSGGRSGLVGLGFEGLEKGGGGAFDGLGRLSEGFRLSESSSGEEGSSQVRPKAVVRPKKRHDVFFPCPHHSRSLSPVSFLARALPNTAVMQFRVHCRNDSGSPTPCMKHDPSRSTVSTELKRAAGIERRASLRRCSSMSGWR
ncbi:uncharacterized protein F5147DRAFT_721049 [Suillus discolor]|uniref:Uncharacterized protein n=1 Tax=Suillus discolor TaxID=1912936 RepID=A0A9P7EX03_9AGAM|nr:uncharacterized protein F5147DRAFT_721049 [Suillus discolor]KAG2093319.1 hypothetical protein F5147DRAFT_721049 [Suillus discolor]